MFNLDTAITEWRQQMLDAGIKTPVPLEELESHLRDDIERQMTSGLNAQQAFEAAVQRIGQADVIDSEFKKTQCRAKSQWQMLWTGGFGLVLTVMLNFVGLFIFHRSSSVFFSHKWCSDWVPSYTVWIIFTITGLAIGLARWKAQRSLQPD
jgi:hypothetical protein